MRMTRYEQLRDILCGYLSDGTWDAIKSAFARIGLEWREDLKPGWGKPKYVGAVLAELSQQKLTELAGRCLDCFPDSPGLRSIQNILWWIESDNLQKITQVTRLSIASSFEGRNICPGHELWHFLSRYVPSEWNQIQSFSYSSDGRIEKRSNTVSFEELFTNGTSTKLLPSTHKDALQSIGFFDWPDKRVYAFLEDIVSPELRTEAEQSQWVVLLNENLQKDGLVLKQTDAVSGRPVFRVRPVSEGVKGRPKNVIFASVGPKPTVGFVDAINNDIIVLDNEASCLIYDEPLIDGLNWGTLVEWWAKKQSVSDIAVARQQLGKRLRDSLAKESPPERVLFDSYFRQVKPALGDKCPALLPQVYLHYDPKTLRERKGEKRFPVQRMDFLLLLPNSIRIVIEIDGSQHYSSNGKPEPKVYAETVRGDRELRLAGYEVYRFAGIELQYEDAPRMIASFFEALFRRHQLLPPHE